MIGKIKEKKTITVPIIAISLSHEFIKNNMDTMGAKKQAAICDFNGAPDKPCGKSVRMLTQNCR